MIVVDFRETRLIEDLARAAAADPVGGAKGAGAAAATATTAALGVGDVLIGDRVLLERKTPRDLDASIADGRWRDQLARMAAARDEHGYRLGVVVEGRVPKGPAWDRVRSAMAGAFVRDGVPCFEVDGPAELARLVRLLSRRADRGEPPSAQRALPRRGGGLMADPRRVAVAQLSVVPGVSDRVAETLLGGHACTREWVAAWAAHAPAARRKAFAEMVVAGGTRRVGPAVAARVDALVFAPGGDGPADGPADAPADGPGPGAPPPPPCNNASV